MHLDSSTSSGRKISKWGFFESAEGTLEKRLKKNSNYPFEFLCSDGIGNDIFVHSRRSPYFYFSLITSIASLILLTIWLLAGGSKEYILFSLLTFVIGCYQCFDYRSILSVVLEPAIGQYSIYVDKSLVVSQHCHNIYIRLQHKSTGFRQTKYYLVVNGQGFESPINITTLTANRTKLRLLAYQMAKQLNLNYFDMNDTSKLHVIRHHPQQQQAL